MRSCKKLLFWHHWRYFWKSYLTLKHLTVIWQLYKTEWEKYKKFNMTWKLTWQSGCRVRWCQGIKCFWKMLSWLNIIVTRWNFGARNKILSFAFLLFLYDNALQKLRIPSHFVKCKPLLRTRYCDFCADNKWT